MIRSTFALSAVLFLAIASVRPSTAQPTLTQEQANSVLGVWQLTEVKRIDGSHVDQKVLEFLRNGDAAFSKGNFEDIIAQSSNFFSFYLYFPYVDTDTGFAIGYRVLRTGVVGVGGFKLESYGRLVRRLLGISTSLPDGSVEIQANNDQDEGIWTFVIPLNGASMEAQLSEGIQVYHPDGIEQLDDQTVLKMKLMRANETVLKGVQETVATLLPLQVNKESYSSGAVQGGCKALLVLMSAILTVF